MLPLVTVLHIIIAIVENEEISIFLNINISGCHSLHKIK